MITAFDVSNIIMHIVLISIFIGIFFFTYGAYLEKEIIKTQVEYLIDDLTGSIKVFLPDISNDIKQKIKDFDIKVSEEDDIKVRNKNNETKKKAFMMIAVLAVVGVILIFAVLKIMKKQNMSNTKFWKTLLKHNAVVLVFIALTYFTFATFFAKKYLSINTNQIKKSTIDNIFKHLEDNNFKDIKLENNKLENINLKDIKLENINLKDINLKDIKLENIKS